MDIPPDEAVLEHALEFLRQRSETAAIAILTQCAVHVRTDATIQDGDGPDVSVVEMEIRGPSGVLGTLQNAQAVVTRAIHAALRQALPEACWIERVVCHAVATADAGDPATSAALQADAAAEPFPASNQGTRELAVHWWNGLRFNSETEVRVAEALEQAGVLFLPNCLARLGSPGGRVNREADFLVCHEGVWGVLEVDGQSFHPASRTAEEHERDRLFKAHGILIVEHFDAARCFSDPAGVVRNFLHVLGLFAKSIDSSALRFPG